MPRFCSTGSPDAEILGGIPLSRWGGDRRQFLVAVTELNTRAEMDHFVAALGGGAQ